jgi:hypothetical protein
MYLALQCIVSIWNCIYRIHILRCIQGKKNNRNANQAYYYEKVQLDVEKTRHI